MDAEKRNLERERGPRLTLRAGPIKTTIAAAAAWLGGILTTHEATAFRTPVTSGISVPSRGEDRSPARSEVFETWLQKMFEESPTFGVEEIEYFGTDRGADRVYFKVDLPEGNLAFVECTPDQCLVTRLPHDAGGMGPEEEALYREIVRKLGVRKPLPLKMFKPSAVGNQLERQPWLGGTIRFGDRWIFILVDHDGGSITKGYDLVRPGQKR